MDLISLTDREDPESSWSVNYTATLTPQLFVEAQYSRHESRSKGRERNRRTDRGHLLIDQVCRRPLQFRDLLRRVPPEERDNESIVAKATYFLSRPRLGTHTIVGGYDGLPTRLPPTPSERQRVSRVRHLLDRP